MWTIHKQKLQIMDEQLIEVGATSEILSVAMQKDELCIWYTFNTLDPKKAKIKIYIHGTGHKITDDQTKFIGTVLLEYLVFHVFNGGPVQ